ncbi:hypothetical protein [Mixta gaviniae]|uniref:hypothetical protein n=1 Tax=Mixta gaviniae TaxID=665914 RepID=UPI000FFC35A5|nr:hypothetical protein [Mixta gaviniae]
MKMNNRDKTIEKLKKCIEQLNKVRVDNDVSVLSISSPEQIGRFINVFEVALHKLLTNNMPPKNERSLGIAQLVADQWPFDLELASIIIDAEQSYKKYN